MASSGTWPVWSAWIRIPLRYFSLTSSAHMQFQHFNQYLFYNELNKLRPKISAASVSLFLYFFWKANLARIDACSLKKNCCTYNRSKTCNCKTRESVVCVYQLAPHLFEARKSNSGGSITFSSVSDALLLSSCSHLLDLNLDFGAWMNMWAQVDGWLCRTSFSSALHFSTLDLLGEACLICTQLVHLLKWGGRK
jgi:hypothetical protein